MDAYIDLQDLLEAAKQKEVDEVAKNDPTGALVRHAMVAISKKPSTRGTGARGKARAARRIAQSQFTRYGLLKPGKNRATYRVTGRGSRFNMKHAMEPSNATKQSEYEKLHKAER